MTNSCVFPSTAAKVTQQHSRIIHGDFDQRSCLPKRFSWSYCHAV